MSPDLFGLRQMKVMRAAAALMVAALGGAAMSGCTSAQQQGQSPAFLIVSALNASSGATPDQFGGVLASDVITLVKIEGSGGGDGEQAPATFAPTVFADNGEVNFVLAMKDPGSIDNPAQPSSQNFITVNRYHVAFVRADGILGREVCQRDDQVDALHDSLFRILLTHMMGDPKLITPSLELLLVSRNLERVADLATNIAEDAVFLAEGKQIKHRSEMQQRPESDGHRK